MLNGYQFTMHNSQAFRGVPSWHPILIASDVEKLRAYQDREVRRKLHEEVVEWKAEIPGALLGPGWYEYIWVDKVKLPEHKKFEGKSIGELAAMQGKGIIDAFLDLAVEEDLDTVFWQAASGHDKEAMTRILNYPHAVIGLSDGGAHVQFRGGAGYSSRLLGYWVREQGIMSLEQAVKRLTFESASVFGIYDRGLLRPGMAADITMFDPATISMLPAEVAHDFPAGAWRMKELATGIHCTIVNGEVLIEDGCHTGALPGRLLRNSQYEC
jgi:N-acyl-D-aspartate/D-glutamate deacylase